MGVSVASTCEFQILELFETIWNYLKLFETIWNYLKLSENYLKLFGTI